MEKEFEEIRILAENFNCKLVGNLNNFRVGNANHEVKVKILGTDAFMTRKIKTGIMSFIDNKIVLDNQSISTLISDFLKSKGYQIKILEY